MFHITGKGSESWRIPAQGYTFSLFLPPKIASAVRKYGDVTIFDASASFLFLLAAVRQKSANWKLGGRQQLKDFYIARMHRAAYFTVAFPAQRAKRMQTENFTANFQKTLEKNALLQYKYSKIR